MYPRNVHMYKQAPTSYIEATRVMPKRLLQLTLSKASFDERIYNRILKAISSKFIFVKGSIMDSIVFVSELNRVRFFSLGTVHQALVVKL